MSNITGLIRADAEYRAFESLLPKALASEEVLPIAVNGLVGGAEVAFVCESVKRAKELSGSPVLIFAPNEAERDRICSALTSSGVNALVYKKRDLVFYNIKASHDVDRERLSVLSAVSCGTCDAVVTTPSAALSHTVPRELLKKTLLTMRVGDILSPCDLDAARGDCYC